MFDKQTVLIALGNFDGLHIGHKKVLQSDKNQYDKKIALMFKEHPRKILSGKAPGELLTPEKRSSILEEWGFMPAYIDFSEVFNLSPREFFDKILIGRFGADALCCGFNYRFGKNAEGNADLLSIICREKGIKLTVSSEVDFKGEPVSSTRIRECILKGDTESAKDMLGRYFSYDFPVVHGDARGRILGSPTINQFFTENFAVPEFGVYASFTLIEGEKYPSVTNIGVRPTIGNSEKRSETNIIGFDGDLYGKRIEVNLVEKIRGEMSFGSLEELSAQIFRDRKTSLEIAKRKWQNEV